MQTLTLGTWDMPVATLRQALDEKNHPSKIVMSETQVVTCRGLDDVCDPAGRGLADVLLQPRQVEVHGIDLLVFPDAKVFSSRLVVSKQNRLYSDYQLTDAQIELLIRGGGDLKRPEHQLAVTQGGYETPVLDTEAVALPGVHVLLTSSEPINYGAWLIRVLPKIYNLRKAGGFDCGRMLCFVERPWQEALLEWMGVPASRIVRQTLVGYYNVETLVVPSWPNRNKFLDPLTLEFIGYARDRVLNPKPGAAGKPLYVSRVGWNKKLDAIIANKPNAIRMRPFDQEQELIERLAALGVESFSPEEHSFEETLLAFATAPLVIGPQGAGLFNAIFCKPGTPVIEIAHLPYFTKGHANMFLSCGHRYMVIVGGDPEEGQEGAHPVHRALTIDVDRTIEFVSRQLQRI